MYTTNEFTDKCIRRKYIIKIAQNKTNNVPMNKPNKEVKGFHSENLKLLKKEIKENTRQ